MSTRLPVKSSWPTKRSLTEILEVRKPVSLTEILEVRKPVSSAEIGMHAAPRPDFDPRFPVWSMLSGDTRARILIATDADTI